MIIFEAAGRRREIVLEWHHSAKWTDFNVEKPSPAETIIDCGKFSLMHTKLWHPRSFACKALGAALLLLVAEVVMASVMGLPEVISEVWATVNPHP